MIRMQFEAYEDGNVLWGRDENVSIRATVSVPEGASEDYGYLAMKDRITKMIGVYSENIAWPYDDRQEKYLEDDARCGDTDTNIGLSDGWDIFEEYGLLEKLGADAFFEGSWSVCGKAAGMDGTVYDILASRDKTQFRYGAV